MSFKPPHCPRVQLPRPPSRSVTGSISSWRAAASMGHRSESRLTFELGALQRMGVAGSRQLLIDT
jgi:hypothetical protein